MLFGENANRPGDGNGSRRLNLKVNVRSNNLKSFVVHDLQSAYAARCQHGEHPLRHLQIPGEEDR